MKIISIIKNLIPNKQPKVLLGRWNIEYCDRKINKKVDLSNEDHCATCNIIKIVDVKKIIFFETI